MKAMLMKKNNKFCSNSKTISSILQGNKIKETANKMELAFEKKDEENDQFRYSIRDEEEIIDNIVE